MKLIRVGVDLAKNVFQVHGVDRNEKPVWRRRLTRDNWLRVLVETVEPGCEIGMEACGGAHYWARKLQERGFSVKLIAPQFVKPYVQSNKNDANDAEAICEAILWCDLRILDERVVELDREIALIAHSDPAARRLQQLRGVGPIIATALVAAVGDGAQFANGRQMAAALGLTPKQHSSGDKERHLGISKRGDAYLRMVLIHGARSAMRTAQGKSDRLSLWVRALLARRHPNVVAAALANKTAPIAWAMLRRGSEYEPELVAHSCLRRPSTNRSNLNPRLHSKPNDGKQVEPAPVEPANFQMREARKSDWELAHE
jgi:transposase